VGPLVVGLAVWCASSRLAVIDSSDAALRVGTLAPWWVLAVAFALAALVPAWRRHRVLASPALLTTLPWWPVPLPAVALLWTGPLAWAPIALAVAAALWASRSSTRPSVFVDITPGQAAVVAGVLTLAAGAVTAWALAPRLPAGDEPHYLVITQSLLEDGDLRIENNHQRGDPAAYFPGELRPDFIQRGRDGQIYSIHAPGVSAIVLPAFAAAGYRGAQLMVLLLAAAAGALMWSAAWRATDNAAAAWFAWAAVAGSATFLLQSAMIFPDGPGAAAAAVGVWLIVRLSDPRSRPGSAAIVLTSVALAALPWLHTRFAVAAAGFGVVILWLIVRDPARALKDRITRALMFLAVPLVSAIGWFAYFRIIYGTFNPAAPYGPRPETSLAYIPGGIAGLLSDAQYGLLPYAPVIGFALVDLVRGRRDETAPSGRVFGAIAAVSLAASATYWMWWAGIPATPARLLTVILPLFAVPLARGWLRADPAGRALRAIALLVSLSASALVIGVDRGDLAWNVYNAQPRWLEWLAPLVNLSRAAPSFFWRLTPGVVSTELPFFVHAGVWVVIVLTCVWAVRQLVRRRASAGHPAGAFVLWSVPLTAMLLVQSGWWLNHAAGLDPARSQIAVLGDLARGRRALRIAPWSLQAVRDPAGLMTIRADEAGVFPQGPGAWGAFTHVPAGTYDAEIATRRPQRGTVAVWINSTPGPLRTLAIEPLSRQTFELALPAGAESLTLVPDSALAAVGGTIALRPRQLDRAGPALARAAMSLPVGTVFFVGGRVFLEGQGFWVAGGERASVVVDARPRPSVTIHLRNGAAANSVAIEAAGVRRTFNLAPGEERDETFPLPAQTAADVTITSASGFRPSDQGSADRRYLGVWVEIR
jgi:hypothetical protein